jgi:hypothetical protein
VVFSIGVLAFAAFVVRVLVLDRRR